MGRITILSIKDRISCFHSLKPFLFSDDPRRFLFTDSPSWCLERDKNKTIALVRMFIKPDYIDMELVRRLRDKYERVVYFHDDAGGGIPRLKLLPYVDLFYAKALFKDRSLYGRSLYGKELYSDYYHANYGINDLGDKTRAVTNDPVQLAKLRLSWNIGIGDYPRGKLRQRAGVAASMAFGYPIAKLFYSSRRLAKNPVAANKGIFPVHARLGVGGTPSISFQRRLILERIKGHPSFVVGEVTQRRFNHEVAHSKITLSPFGWGELCLRDFEAVLAGSLLLKPDMSHLETWPDIFRPEETYVPFDWDAKDLVAKAERWLADEEGRKRIARNAFEAYRDQLAALPDRFEAVMSEIEGS